MSWVLEKQREPLHRDVRLLMLTRNILLPCLEKFQYQVNMIHDLDSKWRSSTTPGLIHSRDWCFFIELYFNFKYYSLGGRDIPYRAKPPFPIISSITPSSILPSPQTPRGAKNSYELSPTKYLRSPLHSIYNPKGENVVLSKRDLF